MPRDPGSRIAGDTTGIVLPLRSFTHGKARLARELDATRRTQFVREMADRVADAARGHAVVVVSSATEVREWARARDLACIDDPGSLDRAATAGLLSLRHTGCDRVVIAHGDLPLARTFEPVITAAQPAVDRANPGPNDDDVDRAVVIVPDHRADGTPVLSIPSAVDFPFAYGPGSFARHCAAAEQLGLDVRVLRDASLGFDVDVPDDLARLGTDARCS